MFSNVLITFTMKIGYPDKWIDYSTLTFAKDEPFLSLVFKAREFDNEIEIKEMNAPTDKAKWHMTPQTVNAYYHPSLNEIVFPAGKEILFARLLSNATYCSCILQPFFSTLSSTKMRMTL